MYVQGSADYIESPSLYEPFDYNLHKILLGQVEQEAGGNTKFRVTLIPTGCLAPWPSGQLQLLNPHLAIFSGSGAWSCRCSTNKMEVLRESHN